MRIDYSIVVVSDMDRAVAFYRDVVGIPLKFQSPTWSEFLTEGATLALHAAPAGGQGGGDRGGPGRGPGVAAPQDDAPGTVRLGFRVADLDAFHARMKERGVPCLSEPAQLFGARIARYEAFDRLVMTVSGGPAGA